MQYFDGYAPSWVEWINDSSCNVVFEDEQGANRVLDTFALPLEDGSKPSLDPTIFRDVLPFTGAGKNVPLQLRGATEADVRPDRPNPNSAWARSLHRPNKHARRESKGKKKNRRKSFPVGGKRRRDSDDDEMEGEAAEETEVTHQYKQTNI